ncbi:MAG: EthD family reductase [Rhodospirillaceae bacterium]|nr:MAG: EthD family reductase [Rhodospirillaceae bacterium]
MYKVLMFFKRKPGLTFQQFKDYYESTHAKLGDKYLRATALKYQRRYLRPISHPVGDVETESDFDCVTEVWFENAGQWKEMAAKVAAPDEAKIVVEDEARFMDRSKTRMYVAEEHTSWEPA